MLHGLAVGLVGRGGARWVAPGRVVFVAGHDGHDPRLQTVSQLVGDLDQHGLKCAGVSADLSPADGPIAVNAEGGCTVDGRRVRIVVVAAADDWTRDRYLRWLVEQGSGGYFVLSDAWGVGGDFEWLARRVQEATGGTVCELGVVDGTCQPLDSGR
jgi:hypothetical protein